MYIQYEYIQDTHKYMDSGDMGLLIREVPANQEARGKRQEAMHCIALRYATGRIPQKAAPYSN